MQSISQHITTETIHIKNLLTNLMECSEIVRWNYSRIVMAGAGDYKWGELNEQGKEIQNQLLTMYKRFISLIRFLATDLSDTQQCILGLSAQKVLGIIEQSGYLVRMNKEELYSAALNAVDTQCNMISAAYKVTDNVYILLPDSTTLISQTELGKWEIEGIDKFKVALMPVVIEELDKNLKNEEIKSVVRNRLLEGFKAGVIIAGIKAKGQDRSNFTGRRKSDQVLLWLDMDNDEDRIIASYYEFVKANPQSQVVLITNNPALQKKAAFSGAAYCTAPLPKLAAANPVKPQQEVQQDAKPVLEPPAAVAKPAKSAAPAVPPKHNKPPRARPPKPALPKGAPPEMRAGAGLIKTSLPPVLPGIPIAPPPRPNIPKPKLDILKPDFMAAPNKPKNGKAPVKIKK